MPVPTLTGVDVLELLPHASIVGPPLCGGQKKVFPIEIDGQRYAAKFVMCDAPDAEEDEPASSRAVREIEILSTCNSEHLVRLGGYEPGFHTIRGEPLYFYCEEWIAGDDVRSLIEAPTQTSITTLKLLALHLSLAVEELWSRNYVHRDIKPENVILRANQEQFVLLDLGFALDLQGPSLSGANVIVGTPPYYSPEQVNLSQKRNMDFRSDLFSIGIVLYETATKVHPFDAVSIEFSEIIRRLYYYEPVMPSYYRADLPYEFDKLVMRLLAKNPHGRYRTCSLMRADIFHIPEG